MIKPTDLDNRAVGGATAAGVPNTCPTCRRPGEVLETRAAAAHRRRRYICPDGHRWSTRETYMPRGGFWRPGDR